MMNNQLCGESDLSSSIHVDIRRPITSIERYPFSRLTSLNKEIVDDQEDKSAWKSRKFSYRQFFCIKFFFNSFKSQ